MVHVFVFVTKIWPLVNFWCCFSVSHKNHWMCADDIDMAKNDKLKAILNKYFDDQENREDPREIGEEEAVQVNV